ncbi:T9SS type A sorting domain-containing protein [Gracilimonas sp.]|uniref:T9SS type A sorting domain-containing protein n=1 Tax=Gracilimonas sp. TaxID=1974203 RepID=UPI0032EC2DBF
MNSYERTLADKNRVLILALLLFLFPAFLHAQNIQVNSNSSTAESVSLINDLEPGWYFYPYFTVLGFEYNFEEFYLSRVEVESVNDIWAIGAGKTFAGDYKGLFMHYRSGSWEVEDEFNLSTENDTALTSLPLIIPDNNLPLYSSGYNLRQYTSNAVDVINPQNSAMPEPMDEGQERIVDMIEHEQEDRLLMLTSYPRLLSYNEDDGWAVYDTSNSPLPAPQPDSINIGTELPARHMAMANGALWITTHREGDGLIKKEGSNWEVFTPQNSDLPSSLVSSIVAQQDGQLWIGTLPAESGTQSGGLVHIKNGNWTVMTTGDGLPNNRVRVHTYEDAGDYLLATFGEFTDQADSTHYGYLAEYDGQEWTVIAEKDEFYNYLGWISVDGDQNKWMSGDFNVLNAGVASLNQVYVSLTDAPEDGGYYQAGSDFYLDWESGSRIDSVALEYSTDGGETWQLEEDGLEPEEVLHEYIFPDEQSENFKLRVSAENIEDVTDESPTFTVLDPDEPFYHLRNLETNQTYEVYDPQVHGWRMANRASVMWTQDLWQNIEYEGPLDYLLGGEQRDFPSFNSLVEAFGEDRTIAGYTLGFNNIIPTLSASVWWGVLREMGFNGVCHGFSVTNLISFTDGKQELGQLGANITGDSLYSAEVNNEIRKMINKVWVRQWSADHFPTQLIGTLSEDLLENLAEKAENDEEITLEDIQQSDLVFAPPVQTLEELKTMLDTPGPGVNYQPLIMVQNGTFTSIHSVVPYKLEQREDNPEIWKIYIHDSNYPADNSTFVEVDTQANTFVYNEPGTNGNPRYFGQTGLFLADPIEDYKTESRMLKEPQEKEGNIRNQITGLEDIGYMFALVDSENNLRITDSQGNVTSLEGDENSTEIPGSFPVIPLVGGEHEPIGYYLVDDEYEVELEYTGQEQGSFTAFTGNSVYKYINHEPASESVDELRYGNSISISGDNQQFDLEAYNLTEDEEQVFRLMDVSVSGSDSVTVQLENGNELNVENYAGATTLDLELRTNFGGEDYFRYEDLELNESSGYKMVVDSWDNLEEQEVTLRIDDNMDGRYENSENLTSIATSSEENEQTEELPQRFNLGQNYPNPFNPSTTIGYSLPEPAEVEIKVYDMLGREVKTLVNDFRNAGQHKVTFDSGNLSSGIYIYKIRAGNYTNSKKMTLLK